MSHKTRSPRDIVDWFGGWLGGEYNADEDFWVSTGAEHEGDHLRRYGHDGDDYYIRDDDD